MSNRLLFILGAMFCHQGVVAQQDLFNAFSEAYQNGDYRSCVTLGNELATTVNHPDLQYMTAQCRCQTGDTDTCLQALQRLAALGLGYRIEGKEQLVPLHNTKAYDALVAKFRANRADVHRAGEGFTLPDSTFFPEGIAAMKDASAFFIGSMMQHKVVMYKPGKPAVDFATRDAGLGTVLGMSVSPDQRTLWVCTVHEQGDKKGLTAAIQFDIRSGNAVRRLEKHSSGEANFFNDVVQSQNGDVFITDSHAGRVWQTKPGQKELSLLMDLQFNYPNGIALDDERQILYVADFGGITVVNLNDTTAKRIDPGNVTYLNGIDGLYFHRGALIAIQNGAGHAERIMRFTLNEDGSAITKADVLQTPDKHFAVPTTGAIAGNHFFFIANSHLGQLGAEGRVNDAHLLRRPTVLKLSLHQR